MKAKQHTKKPERALALRFSRRNQRLISPAQSYAAKDQRQLKDAPFLKIPD